MATRRGDTLIFSDPPVIAAHAAVGGKKEGAGPLAAGFDELRADNSFGRSGWEAAEAELQLRAARLCLKKAQIPEKEVSLVLAGDLQAQCTASNYALRALGIPYAGLFGACSTMAEALGLALANQRLRSALLEKALFDSLTGLRNRHHLDEALHSQMALAVHTHTPLSCLMIDIDHFKAINDRYGHEAGDLVIKSVATIVQRAVRDIGMAFRYGGEEFLVLLPGIDEAEAHQCASEIYTQVHNMTLRDGLTEIGQVDVSIGIASYPQHTQSDSLLRAADARGDLHFIGNIEAKDAIKGGCDVIVTDGFSGNVMLKTIEGVGSFAGSALKTMFKKNLLTKIAALLVMPGLNAFKARLDPNKVGGTAFIGISRPVIKAHGGSNAEAIENAVGQAIQVAQSGITEAIAEHIDKMQLPTA